VFSGLQCVDHSISQCACTAKLQRPGQSRGVTRVLCKTSGYIVVQESKCLGHVGKALSLAQHFSTSDGGYCSYAYKLPTYEVARRTPRRNALGWPCGAPMPMKICRHSILLFITDTRAQVTIRTQRTSFFQARSDEVGCFPQPSKAVTLRLVLLAAGT
jgi:hypothetical protein